MLMYEATVKRLIDVLVAALLLSMTLPVTAVAVAAVWLEDRFSPIFRQVRVGRDGRPFTIIKLRTMAPHTADVDSANAGTLAVTRTGAVLRRLNVDELPQLINVLQGDMSLVGPRPALPSQETLLSLRREHGALDVKPGLTGLAQIRAYDGMPDHVKAQHDAEYALSITLMKDIEILCRTIGYLSKPPPRY